MAKRPGFAGSIEVRYSKCECCTCYVPADAEIGPLAKEMPCVEANFIKWTCAIVLALVGLDLYSYYVHELLVSLALFSIAFFLLALIVLVAILLWWASAGS